MKHKSKILSLAFVMATLCFYSCYDDKMDWGHEYGNVSTSEIPLSLAENLANYDFIKAYAMKHVPHMSIGVGLDVGFYTTDDAYRKVADENFQIFTAGNAMKHSSVVNSRGEYNFNRIDAFFAAVPNDIEIYGHNYIWHSQQPAAYLNSLIAPIVVPPTSGANLVDISGLQDGTFTGWNKANEINGTFAIVEGQGLNAGDPAIKVVVTSDSSQEWDVQLESPEIAAIADHAYSFSFWIRSEEDALFRMSFNDKMSNRWPWYEGSSHVPTTSTWKQVTYGADGSLTANGSPVKMYFDMGKAAGTYYIDINSIKVVDLDAEPTELNYVVNGDFEKGDLSNWNAAVPGDGISIDDSEKNTGIYSAKLVATSTSASEWDLQLQTEELALTTGTTYTLSFYIKSDVAGQGRVSFPGNENEWPWMDWQGKGAESHFSTTGGVWDYINVDFTPQLKAGATGVRLSFDLGKLPNITYWLDDVKLVEKSEEPVRAKMQRSGPTIIEKSAEEKKAILLEAMESWIKTMAEHCKGRVKAWDVLNEAISDGGSLRGVDFVPPAEEIGAEEFYWGQYIGKEYAVKAFQFARQYGNPDDKLFINDYGLETNPTKLAAFLDYVKYIDETNNSPIIDGVGTQMHVHIDQITRTQIDDMFKKLAGTGKLVRVTELDVQTGTATPSFDQLEKQAQVYQMIVDSFKENVPEAQQSGITVWTLTDNKREHEYWIPDDSPNLFDADYGRKYAYKNFCDGIAGYDISSDFNGDDWKKFYQESTEGEN